MIWSKLWVTCMIWTLFWTHVRQCVIADYAHNSIALTSKQYIDKDSEQIFQLYLMWKDFVLKSIWWGRKDSTVTFAVATYQVLTRILWVVLVGVVSCLIRPSHEVNVFYGEGFVRLGSWWYRSIHSSWAPRTSDQLKALSNTSIIINMHVCFFSWITHFY